MDNEDLPEPSVGQQVVYIDGDGLSLIAYVMVQPESWSPMRVEIMGMRMDATTIKGSQGGMCELSFSGSPVHANGVEYDPDHSPGTWCWPADLADAR